MENKNVQRRRKIDSLVDMSDHRTDDTYSYRAVPSSRFHRQPRDVRIPVQARESYA
jgi:hypothetical protein